MSEDKSLDSVISALDDMLLDVIMERMDKDGKTGEDMSYLQGQKDGLRKALIVLLELTGDATRARSLETVRESSFEQRKTKLEQLENSE